MTNGTISLDQGGAFAGEVTSGTVAYADAEWARDPGPIPALVYTTSGCFDWAGVRGDRLKAGTDPDVAAAQILLSVAEWAAAVVQDKCGDGSVEVTGDGVIARVTKALVLTANKRAEHPQLIIDTTGDARVLLACTQRLVAGGTLVLAGAHTARIPIDLYPDVHVRGLRMQGVESPRLHDGAVERALPDVFGASLARVNVGDIPPNGAGWYRVQF